VTARVWRRAKPKKPRKPRSDRLTIGQLQALRAHARRVARAVAEEHSLPAEEVLGGHRGTRAVWAALCGFSTNTVSERLNSRAIVCMRRASSPSASSTTASGLPPKRLSVNTSRM